MVGNDLCLLVENSIVNGSCRNRGNKNCGRPLCCCAVVEKSIEEQYSTNGSCRICGSMNCVC